MADPIYSPPLIVRANAKFGTLGPVERTDDPSYSKGKFVVYADGSRVRLYSMLWLKPGDSDESLVLFPHKSILAQIQKIGESTDITSLLLAGGTIVVNDAERQIETFGRSTTQGSAPRLLLENLLAVPDYNLRVSADEFAVITMKQIETGVMDWYSRHGFDARLAQNFPA